MKKVLIEMLMDKGFTEQPIESELLCQCNGLILQRDFEKEIEVAFYGKRTEHYSIRVFINQDSGICHVSYQQDGRESKSRWYDTIGKRTYNAIVATMQNAGYEM